MSQAFRDRFNSMKPEVRDKIDISDPVFRSGFASKDFSGDKGFTVQSNRDAADINKIVARLEKGAAIDRLSLKEPFYGDVSGFTDLAKSMEIVLKANALFMDYPAELREKFDNDPRKFVSYFQDPNNIPEAIELGLALPKPKASVEPPPSSVPEPGK